MTNRHDTRNVARRDELQRRCARRPNLAFFALLAALSSTAVSTVSSSGQPQGDFELQGRTATSDALKMTIAIPAPWRDLGVAGVVGFEHPTAVRFVAKVLVELDAGARVDPTLDLMLANKRKQYGALTDVQWGQGTIAGIEARTVAFSFSAPTGRARMKIWIVTKQQYWGMFTCGAAEGNASEGEKLCRQVLNGAKFK